MNLLILADAMEIADRMKNEHSEVQRWEYF